MSDHNDELAQIIEIRKRRVRLTRGIHGTRATWHDAGPWMIVMSPRSQGDDLAPSGLAEIWRFCLELPGFSARAHWITVDHEVAAVLAVGYLLAPMVRVGDPPA